MKVFIDAGYYAGKALEYYAPFLDDSWTVYAFEPIDAFGLDRFPFKVNLIKKAVWIKDETLNFAVGGREDANHIQKLRGTEAKTVKVEGIDFSKFVKDLPDVPIVCSMDIEGAEFPVLRKMIVDGTIQKIALLDIEFHTRLLVEEDGESTSLLRRELESLGVLVKLKLEI